MCETCQGRIAAGGFRLTSVECVRLGFESRTATRKEDKMKRSLLVVGVAAALMVAWSVGRVQGKEGQAEKVIFVSANQANYIATPNGVSMAALW